MLQSSKDRNFESTPFWGKGDRKDIHNSDYMSERPKGCLHKPKISAILGD